MTPEQLAEIRKHHEDVNRAVGIVEHGAEMVGPEPVSYTKDEALLVAFDALRKARTDIPALLDYIEELQEALRGIEDCVAHPDRVKGEIAGTICGKCLAQVSTLTSKESTNA